MTHEDTYDVAFSFAGEDRDYVRAVADRLQASGVHIFFDDYEQVNMWGKDLYEHLHEIYSSRAEYCVIFISESYARKNWTTLERRSAQERALRENREYILPARFDATELPGLPSTVGYIDLRKLAPQQFADVILSKLRRTATTSAARGRPSFRLPRRATPYFDPYAEGERFIEFLDIELSNRSPTLERANAHLSVHSRGERRCFRLLRGDKVLFSMDVWMGGLSGDKGLSFYAVDGKIRHPSTSINAWAELAWDRDSDQVIMELHDMSLLGHVPGVEKKLTFDEFADQIWDRIVDSVEETP